MRISFLLLALVAFSAHPAAAQDADLARLFPADTFLYAEVDAGAVEKGLAQLDLVKILKDEKTGAFFKPTVERLGLDPADPAGSLIKRSNLKQFLAGRAAVGVRGFALVMRDDKGKESRVEIAPDAPIDARKVHQVLGAALRVWRAAWGDGAMPDITLELDMLAVVDVGPALKAMAAQHLQNLPQGVKVTDVEFGGKKAKRISTHARIEGVEIGLDIYADMSGDRWIVSTKRDRFASALAGGPRSSLANAPGFTAVRDRFTSGHRALFAFANTAQVMQIVQKLIPPIVAEEMEICGCSSMQGVAMGVSFAEGGVRESFGLVLDGKPKGLWRLLDAFPGGMRSLEVAPPGAIAAFGVKFDANLLLQRARELMGELAPGNEDLVDKGLQELSREAGMDLAKDVLPAFGDEIGIIVYPAKMLVPEIVFGMDIRDEATFKKLLEVAKKMVVQGGMAQIEAVKLMDGVEGFQVFSGLPMQLTFAVHKGHFMGASSPDLLKKVLTEWGAEGAPSLVRNDDVLPKVLKGLNGGDASGLIALGYVNLRAIVPQAFQLGLPMVAQDIPDGWLDKGKAPDVNKLAGHMSGVAVGLRRDANGIAVDTFSPTGVAIPAMAAAAYMAVARADAVARQVEEIQRQRRAEQENAPVFGVAVSDTPDASGALITGFYGGGHAQQAGLQANDKIVEVNGARVANIDDLRRETMKHKPGDTVKVKVQRGDKTVEMDVRLARRGDLQNR